MSINVENLTYIYSKGSPYEKTALDCINLRIEEGEFFGIIGHTGSGKTTLVGHLNALTRIQNGSVTIGDIQITPKNFKKIDFKKLRGTVGMVFQYPEYQLFDETVQRDVGFGPKNLKLPAEEIAARVRESIELVGLDYEKIKDRSPFDLSGGQKRRAAIAGVLAMRPSVLILDEPTAGLDPRGKKEILALIRSVKEKMCPTVIMISHNMDEIASVCDRIAVLHGGKLACVKTPRELFSERQLLEQLGVQMPQVAAIANRLADEGLTIRRDIVTEEELADEIIRSLKERCDL